MAGEFMKSVSIVVTHVYLEAAPVTRARRRGHPPAAAAIDTDRDHSQTAGPSETNQGSRGKAGSRGRGRGRGRGTRGGKGVRGRKKVHLNLHNLPLVNETDPWL